MASMLHTSLVAELADSLSGVDYIVSGDISKVPATDVNRLRVQLRKSGYFVLSCRPTLAKRALAGTSHEAFAASLTGATTLIWGGEDPVALAKVVTAWAKQLEGVKITGGSVEGKGLDASGVEALSKSPGRTEILANIAAAILGPGSRLAGALVGPGSVVCGALKSRGNDAN